MAEEYLRYENIPVPVESIPQKMSIKFAKAYILQHNMYYQTLKTWTVPRSLQIREKIEDLQTKEYWSKMREIKRLRCS